MKVDLEPCSRCQGRAIVIPYGNLSGDFDYQISCICGNSSPMCKTEEDAIECWQYSNGSVYLKAVRDILEKR